MYSVYNTVMIEATAPGTDDVLDSILEDERAAVIARLDASDDADDDAS